jgi:peptidoglycan/LPS O-acetylase OafA/YrhL
MSNQSLLLKKRTRRIFYIRRIQENKPALNKLYYPELDGLRFFAFLTVFVNHHSIFSITPYYNQLFDYAWVIVDLFFVLSAFLSTKLLRSEFEKNKTISLKKFYCRRILRIWPIYFLITVLSLTALLLKTDINSANSGARVLGLLTFSDNIMAAFKGLNALPFTLHLWAISYEEQFCMLMPFIIIFLIRTSVKKRIVCFLVVFLLLNGIRFAFIKSNAVYPAIYVLPVTHFESVMMGIVMGFGGGDYLLNKTNRLTLTLICLLSAILLFVLPTNEDPASYWHIASYSFSGVFVTLILYLVLNGNVLRQALSNKLLVFLGKRSYGLFIYHLLGISIANYIVKHEPVLQATPVVSWIYSLGITLLIAITSYEIIEKPFLKRKKKFEVVTSRPV